MLQDDFVLQVTNLSVNQVLPVQPVDLVTEDELVHKVTRVLSVLLVPQAYVASSKTTEVFPVPLVTLAPLVSAVQPATQVVQVYVVTPVLLVDTATPVSQVKMAVEVLLAVGVLLVLQVKMLS